MPPNEYCLAPFMGLRMKPDREPCLPQGLVFFFFTLFVFCSYTTTKENPPPQCMKVF